MRQRMPLLVYHTCSNTQVAAVYTALRYTSQLYLIQPLVCFAWPLREQAACNQVTRGQMALSLFEGIYNEDKVLYFMFFPRSQLPTEDSNRDLKSESSWSHPLSISL